MGGDPADLPLASEGSFDVTSGAEIVRRLFSLGASGRLVAENNGHKKALYIRDGIPLGAKSNQLDETLLRLALRLKAIDQATFSTVIEASNSGDKVLHGQQLVACGVPQATVDALLERQTAVRFADLCTWTSGRYRWSPDLPKEIPGSPTTTVAVFVEYIKLRFTPEMLKRAAQQTTGKVLVKIPDLWQRHRKAVAAHPATKQLMAKLEALERAPTSDIAPPEGADAVKAWLGLYALIELGVLALVDAPASTAAKAASGYEDVSTHSDHRNDDPELVRVYHELSKLDYFAVLGLERNADAKAVKRAYFKLAKQYHPDRYFDHAKRRASPTAEKVFALINRAYEELRDDQRRATYRDYLERGTSEEEEMRRAEAILKSEVEFQKGRLLTRRKQYREAATHLRRAIELHPDEPEYHIYLLWNEFLLAYPNDKATIQRTTTELAALLQQQKNKKRFADAFFFLGRMYKIGGNTGEAERAFAKVLEYNPNHKDAAAELRALKRASSA